MNWDSVRTSVILSRKIYVLEEKKKCLHLTEDTYSHDYKHSISIGSGRISA